MIPLFSENDFLNALYRETLPLKCKYCEQTFYRTKGRIHLFRIDNQGRTGDFCSNACSMGFRSKNLSSIYSCSYCSKLFKRNKYAAKSINLFCSQTCSASYNNKNKKFGSRRSKLETWLEEQLNILFPNLEILYNEKEAINSELDIYIPSLKLAFELNGIFHYEPIFGEEKLNQIQNNDDRKFQACIERGIELCLIDTSKHKYVTEKTCAPFLEIVRSIIDRKLQ